MSKSRKYFKPHRNYRRPVDEQGLIFYICRNYKLLSPARQKYVDELILSIGGANAEALREYLTTALPPQLICDKHYIASATQIYRLSGSFFRAFDLIFFFALDGK